MQHEALGADVLGCRVHHILLEAGYPQQSKKGDLTARVEVRDRVYSTPNCPGRTCASKRRHPDMGRLGV